MFGVLPSDIRGTPASIKASVDHSAEMLAFSMLNVLHRSMFEDFFATSLLQGVAPHLQVDDRHYWWNPPCRLDIWGFP